MNQKVGLYEFLTRVTFFIPWNERDHNSAVNDVISYLEKQGPGTDCAPVKGYTRSAAPIMNGAWLDESINEWCREHVCMFIIDFFGKKNDRKIQCALAALDENIKNIYEYYGHPQKLLWITVAEITLHVGLGSYNTEPTVVPIG